MSRRLPLSPEEKAQIADLRNSGLTGYEVAARVGRSKSVVYKYLPRKDPRPRWTERDAKKLLNGYAAGRPVCRISAWIGRSPLAIRLAMCRYRQKVRRDPKKREVMHWLKVSFDAGARPGEAIVAIRRAKILGEGEAIRENDL